MTLIFPSIQTDIDDNLEMLLQQFFQLSTSAVLFLILISHLNLKCSMLEKWSQSAEELSHRTSLEKNANEFLSVGQL